jgi:hypothetical protein
MFLSSQWVSLSGFNSSCHCSHSLHDVCIDCLVYLRHIRH